MPGIGNNTLRRLNTQLRRAERGEFDNRPLRSRPHVPKGAPPRVVMLLEDCESGDRAQAAVLVEVESTETQIVEFCGVPLSGTFTLGFNGQTTAPLAYDVTAEEMQEALEALSNISPGDVVVEFGPGASLGARKIYRWFVSFTGQYAGDDVPELVPVNVDLEIQGAATQVDALIEVRSLPDFEDTGDTLNVLCVTPLPPGVSLKAGTIGVSLPIPTFGYCLITGECRDCDVY